MKLFVLLSRVPYPLEKGDKLRAYHLVKRLAQKHDIFLCCLSDQAVAPDAVEHLRGFCQHIEVVHLPRWRIVLKLANAVFSRLPFQVSYFHQRHAQRQVDTAIERFKPDHIFCQLVRTTEYVRERWDLPKTIDYMDTLSKGMERRTESGRRGRARARRLHAFSRRAASGPAGNREGNAVARVTHHSPLSGGLSGAVPEVR